MCSVESCMVYLQTSAIGLFYLMFLFSQTSSSKAFKVSDFLWGFCTFSPSVLLTSRLCWQNLCHLIWHLCYLVQVGWLILWLLSAHWNDVILAGKLSRGVAVADTRLCASLVLLKFSFVNIKWAEFRDLVVVGLASPNEARRTLPDSFCGTQTSLQIVHGQWEVKRLLVHTRYVIKL